MVSNNARHIRALRVAEEKIFQSKPANYVRELYLYGSMARGEIRWDSYLETHYRRIYYSEKSGRECKKDRN